jgi:hypothetical protein
MSTLPPPGKPESPVQRRLLWLVALAVLAVLLVIVAGKWFESGFQEGRSETGVVAENHTTVTLTFEMPRGALSAFTLGSLPPGRSGLLISEVALGPYSLLATNGCSKYDIVAYDPDGREVARRGPGLCMGDTWVVEIPASAAPS